MDRRDDEPDWPTKSEQERYERVRARVGVGAISAERRFKERNAVAAASASIDGKRMSKAKGYGNWAWGKTK